MPESVRRALLTIGLLAISIGAPLVIGPNLGLVLTLVALAALGVYWVSSSFVRRLHPDWSIRLERSRRQVRAPIAPPPRVFVADNVTPAFLVALGRRDGLLSHQAEALKQSYLGKWIHVSGTVSDIRTLGTAGVSVDMNGDPTIYMRVAPQWQQAAIGLIRGSTVRAVARISAIDHSMLNYVGLEDGELLNDDDASLRAFQ